MRVYVLFHKKWKISYIEECIGVITDKVGGRRVDNPWSVEVGGAAAAAEGYVGLEQLHRLLPDGRCWLVMRYASRTDTQH